VLAMTGVATATAAAPVVSLGLAISAMAGLIAKYLKQCSHGRSKVSRGRNRQSTQRHSLPIRYRLARWWIITLRSAGSARIRRRGCRAG
jgi:hypothetical protein